MNRRWTIRWASYAVAAVALTALLPLTHAAAETTNRTVVLASGETSAGAVDSFTVMSLDEGATWQPAVIVEPYLEWDVLPGSQWVSSDRDRGTSRGASSTYFRRGFTLPAGMDAPELVLCVLADASATVRLNGTVVIEQLGGESLGNVKDPADCYAQRRFVDPTLLRPGPNVLDFAVSNIDGPTGLDYRADLSYSVNLDAPPVLLLPDDITVAATSPGGATVGFEARALDTGETALWLFPACTPAPNVLFPVGTTTVTCTATGSRGNTSTGAFGVTVTAPDQPPVLTLPADITTPATSPAGAAVTFLVSATDDTPAPLQGIACTPGTGSTFPIGTTTVACTATDALGATSSGSFTVTVTPVVSAPDYLARLGAAIADGRNIRPGIRALLASKHQAATGHDEAGRTGKACRVLTEMDAVVVKYRGSGIPVGKATNLRNLIKASRAQLGC